MTWKPPSEVDILQTIDATWPAARTFSQGPFTLRMGWNGGQRVSAATVDGLATNALIGAAERTMLAMDQHRLFLIKSSDSALDAVLKNRAYRVKDPVTMFASPIEKLTGFDPKGLVAIRAPEPLQIIKDIWAAGGISAGRLAVMARVAGPKAYFLGRANDTPAGAAFVAMHGNTAMLHALEVLPDARRQGLGLAMTGAAATWAQEQGADTFSLVAVTANTAACNLYRRSGMVSVGHYHYRIKD